MVERTPALRKTVLIAGLVALGLAALLGPVAGLFLGGGVLIVTGIAINERKLVIAGIALVVLTVAAVLAFGIGGGIGGATQDGVPAPVDLG